MKYSPQFTGQFTVVGASAVVAAGSGAIAGPAVAYAAFVFSGPRIEDFIAANDLTLALDANPVRIFVRAERSVDDVVFRFNDFARFRRHAGQTALPLLCE